MPNTDTKGTEAKCTDGENTESKHSTTKSTETYDTEIFLLDTPNDLISLEKWQKTVNLLAKLFDAPAGFLVQFTPKKGFQVTISSEQESNPYPAGVIIEPDVNIFCRRIVETRKELYVPDAPLDPCWDTNPEVHNDGFRSYLGLPVFWPNGTPFGTFCVMDYKATDYENTYLELIRQLKDILESDLALIDLYLQVQQLAITDPLTALSNRRGFSMLAAQRITLASRMKSSLAMFYIDVDDFKSINDTFGHSVGDDVLVNVARAIEVCVRKSDVIGRMGGDEFVALMLVEDLEDIQVIKQKLHEAFDLQKQVENLPNFTASVGAIAVDLNLDIAQLLELADKDMLAQKR